MIADYYADTGTSEHYYDASASTAGYYESPYPAHAHAHAAYYAAQLPPPSHIPPIPHMAPPPPVIPPALPIPPSPTKTLPLSTIHWATPPAHAPPMPRLPPSESN